MPFDRMWATAFACCCLQHALLLVSPQPLFPHQRTHKNYTVHMRTQVPGEIVAVLDRVDARLAVSELHDPDAHHRIYIVNSLPLARSLLLRNLDCSCNLPTGDTFIASADVASDVVLCPPPDPPARPTRALSEVIAHEITHALVRQHVGWLALRQLPDWIEEGYCEYIANGSALDPQVGAALLRAGAPADTPGLARFQHRLMIAYLLNVQRLPIDDVLCRPPDYATVAAAVLTGLRTDEAAFLRKLSASTGLSQAAAAGFSDPVTTR